MAELIGKGRNVARQPPGDDRQPDFFASAQEVATPRSRPVRQPKPKRDAKDQSSPPNGQAVPERASPVALAARLCRAEMVELAAALSDEALAHLVVAAVRQLRRRLARGNRRPGKGHTSTLDRAVQQLTVELGESHGDDGDL